MPDLGYLSLLLALAVVAFLTLLAYGLMVRGAGPVSQGLAPSLALSLFDGGQLLEVGGYS